MKMSEHWINVYPEWCQRYSRRELADFMEEECRAIDGERVMLLHMVPVPGGYSVEIIPNESEPA